MKSHRKTGWFSLLGLLLILAIVTISPAVAAPILPHTFYGNVTIGSQPAPVNTHITASVTGGGGDL
ncbi:MAG TPA: hypothetical protein PLK38_09430, partial [Methanoregulaceae archaeon]|nr:hypothetical protein [Methanoregulaceae archaeon]